MEKLDFLGITPFMMYRGHFCSRTLIGGILSLISGLSISLLITYYLFAFINGSKFTIYESQSKTGDSARFWSPEDFSIIVLDKYFNQIEESERYFDIYGEIWTDKRITQSNGTIKSETIIKEIELTTCNITKYKNFDLWKDEKLINISTCFGESIVEQKVNSTGNFGARGYTGIVIWIHLCNNNTQKHNCYSKEISREKLQNIFVLVKFYDYYFDHESYDNYSKPYIYSKLIQASSSIYQRVWYESQKIIYTIDKSLMINGPENKEYMTLSSSYSSSDLRTNTTIEDSFFVLSLNMAENTKVIHKVFYKTQDLCADIGGIISIIYYIGKMINYFLTINLFYQNIINDNINNYVPKDDFYASKLFTEISVPFSKKGIEFPSNITPIENSIIGKNISIKNYKSQRSKNNFQSPKDVSISCSKISLKKKEEIPKLLKINSWDNNKKCLADKEKKSSLIKVRKKCTNNVKFQEKQLSKIFANKSQYSKFSRYRNSIKSSERKNLEIKPIKLPCKYLYNPILSLFPSRIFSKTIKAFSEIEILLIKQLDISNYIKNMNNLEKLFFCLLRNGNLIILNRCYNAMNFKAFEGENGIDNFEANLPDECYIVKNKIQRNIFRDLSGNFNY